MANNAKVWTLQAKRFETPDVLSEDLGKNLALGKKDGVSVYTKGLITIPGGPS